MRYRFGINCPRSSSSGRTTAPASSGEPTTIAPSYLFLREFKHTNIGIRARIESYCPMKRVSKQWRQFLRSCIGLGIDSAWPKRRKEKSMTGRKQTALCNDRSDTPFTVRRLARKVRRCDCGFAGVEGPARPGGWIRMNQNALAARASRFARAASYALEIHIVLDDAQLGRE